MSDRNSDFSIRKITTADLNSIAQLKRDSIARLNINDYSSEQVTALQGIYRQYSTQELTAIDNFGKIVDFFNPEQDTNNPKNIVACQGNEIIGYAYISNLDWLNSSQRLYELFVHPEYTRQGVGTRLLQTLETNASDRNCRIISLLASITGEPFYQANGYQSIEKTSFFTQGVRIPVIYMEKWLIEPSEMEKMAWNISQQTTRNFDWLITQTEANIRDWFNIS